MSGGGNSQQQIVATSTVANDAAANKHSASASHVAPFAASPAVPNASIAFGQLPTNLPKDQQSYTLYVKLIDVDGNTFSQSYNIQTGTPPETVRDLVYNSIPAGPGGWVISKSGTTSLVVTGHMDSDRGLHAISKVGSVATQVAANQQPSVSGTSGVKRGQSTNGTDWKFSFNPNPVDGTNTIQENAVVQATVDGVQISAPVSAGMTTSQVAQATYSAMLSAGMTDAVLNGSEIDFLNDTTGQETLSAGLSFYAPPGEPSVGWMEPDLTIAQRNILS